MVFMENFRHNMTEGGNFYNFKITELGDYYDFLAARELLLNDKFQFNAVPFYIGVDKDGNIVSHDEVNKYVDE